MRSTAVLAKKCWNRFVSIGEENLIGLEVLICANTTEQRIKLIYVDEKEDERRLFLHFYDEGRRVDERAYAWYGKSDEPAELELEKLKAFESFVDYAKGLLADEQIDWFELIEKLSHKSGWQHYEYRHKGTTLGKAGSACFPYQFISYRIKLSCICAQTSRSS